MALAPLVREVIGVDPVPEMLDRARRLASAVPNVRFVEGSVYELPVDDASIDIAAIVRTLHHLDRPGDALRELARVLAPGRRVVVIDQLVSEDEREAELYERIERMRDRAHVQTLPDTGLRNLLDDAGLVVTRALIEPEERNLGVFLDLAGCDESQRAAIFEYVRELVDSGESAGVDLRAADGGFRFTGRVGFYVAETPSAA